jgi:hypothetical protein
MKRGENGSIKVSMEYPSALSGLVLVVRRTRVAPSLIGGRLKHMTTLRFEEASRYGRGKAMEQHRRFFAVQGDGTV